MFKGFLMKQLLKRKMKDVPVAEQEKIMKIVEEKPELLEKIAREVQGRMSQGKDQMTAMMEVMQKHQDELKEILEK
jgi:hypothetical protein